MRIKRTHSHIFAWLFLETPIREGAFCFYDGSSLIIAPSVRSRKTVRIKNALLPSLSFQKPEPEATPKSYIPARLVYHELFGTFDCPLGLGGQWLFSCRSIECSRRRRCRHHFHSIINFAVHGQRGRLAALVQIEATARCGRHRCRIDASPWIGVARRREWKRICRNASSQGKCCTDGIGKTYTKSIWMWISKAN